MGRRELREHIFRLLFRRDFFPEEEMKKKWTILSRRQRRSWQ